MKGGYSTKSQMYFRKIKKGRVSIMKILKSFLSIFLSALVFSLNFVYIDSIASSDGYYKGKNVDIAYNIHAFIPYGNDEKTLTANEFALEMESLGPKSFAIAEDGTIYILDTLSYKIKQYTSNGEFMQSFDLPTGFYGIDMDFSEDNLSVLSDSGDLLNMKKIQTGSSEWKSIDQSISSGVSIEDTIGLYCENGLI